MSLECFRNFKMGSLARGEWQGEGRPRLSYRKQIIDHELCWSLYLCSNVNKTEGQLEKTFKPIIELTMMIRCDLMNTIKKG